MEVGAVLTDEDSKSHVSVSAPIFLAVDAESVELVLVDKLFENARGGFCLGV